MTTLVDLEKRRELVEGLRRFKQHYDQVLAGPGALDEANTKISIVNELLRAVGWRFKKDEVECEFPVQMASGRAKVDYCLKTDDGPLAFVEAKPLDTPLGDDEFAQAISYGRVDRVRWCMLTNGREWVVLDADAQSSKRKECEVFRFNIADVENLSHYLGAISPQGMRERVLEALAEDLGKRKAMIGRFGTARTEITTNLSRQLAPFLPATRVAELIESFLAGILSEIEGGAVEDPSQPMPPKKSAKGLPQFRTSKRAKFPSRGKDVVAIFPAWEQGIPFVKEHRAWGQVTIARLPDYVALYVTRPTQKILYVAPVRAVSSAPQWLASKRISDPFDRGVDPRKMVVEFEGDALELEDPIPSKPGDPNIQGLRYATLSSFKTATRISELEFPDFGSGVGPPFLRPRGQ